MWTRGEGVKKSENFVDIISVSPYGCTTRERDHTLICVSVKSLDLILNLTSSSRAIGPTVQRMRVQRCASQSLLISAGSE